MLPSYYQEPIRRALIFSSIRQGIRLIISISWILRSKAIDIQKY